MFSFFYILGWHHVKDGQPASCFLGDLETEEAGQTVLSAAGVGGVRHWPPTEARGYRSDF